MQLFSADIEGAGECILCSTLSTSIERANNLFEIFT